MPASRHASGVPLRPGARDLPSVYPRGLAKPEPRADWADPALDHLADLWSDLKDPHRAELAFRWGEMGLRKHAQLASLSRLTTWLLRLGAPWELIVRAQRAGSEATAHVEHFFGMASILHGYRVGPGPATPSDARLPQLDALVGYLIGEGAVALSLSCAESDFCASRAGSEQLARTLRHVARDEGFAAEVYYRTVRFLLEQEPRLDTAVLTASRAIRTGLETDLAKSSPGGDEWMAFFGVAPLKTRRQIHQEAFQDDVQPCLAEMLRESGLDWDLVQPAW